MTGDSSRDTPFAAGPGTRPAGSLAGTDVVLLRSPDRAGPMAGELRSRGARVRLMPLIDFQRPADTEPMSAGLHGLGRGEFDWIIVTSATTVQALGTVADAAGSSLAVLCRGTSVAAVGLGTSRALKAAGITPDLLPSRDQSARGLAAIWPAPGAGRNRIFLPQANIASPFLRTRLAAAGWDVVAVPAYETVDYPAPDDRRIMPRGSAPGEELLAPADYRSWTAAGSGAEAARPHAAVVTSPSTARRFVRDARPPGTALLVAIGDPTAAELAGLGHPAAATAEHPTPAGIADAVEAALAAPNFQHPDPEGREQP
ncbi:uroporphyrinogen-III synthase [Arthrobacter gandavensis]|uniref:uroporphyrinogen-III synthase n=1 Tax=Arthrobacter gandavensis TaxID=169960 RepID=UPI00189033D9|nr:uroporphyrinogen-III synthase [Arthrobacter gandavensis]MBF4993727.1 uroporphyrinogen-III synthase [Arthrobacter gandavensis]